MGEQLNVSNHCITNSAEDLPDVDDLMTRKGPDPRTPDTNRTDKDKEVSKEEEEITIVKDEVGYHFKVYFMTVFDLEQVTHLSNHNSSRRGATASLTKNDSINLA